MKPSYFWGIPFVVLFLSSTSYGQVLHVDPDAANQPDTYRTIQEALDNAPDSGQIVVKGGSYPENIVISRPVTLKGEPDQVVTVAGTPDKSGGALCTVNNVKGCSLENLVFLPGSPDPLKGRVIWISGGLVDNPTMPDRTIGREGLLCGTGCKVVLEDCVIRNATRFGLTVSQKPSYAKVTRCRITNNGEDEGFISTEGLAGRFPRAS